MMARAESALRFISPVEREVWVLAGMALKSEFGESGRDIWLDWSRQADSFRESDARAVWKSFKGAGVSMGSLYHQAKAAGWVDNDQHARPTAAQLHARQQAGAEQLTQQGREREAAQQQAASKAGWIFQQTKNEKHAYLHSKGFVKAVGPVWWPTEKQNLLCIPMRVGQALVGVQMIDREGSKRYLSGQRTSGAEYLISNNGPRAMDWWVEGFATGLSLRDCLNALKLRYRIHITFSAGNLKAMAHTGFVVADNDESQTGEKAAIATDLPYLLPPAGDFNDWHRKDGTFTVSQAVRKWMNGLTQAA